MNAAQRRKAILERLTEASAPLSASVLAGALGVSRQIVVGDVALLRAAGLAAADVACLALAGALGEHCPPACLEELGFLPSGMGRRVRAVGNSSLDGAALLAAEPWRLPALARWCAAATLVPVAEDPGFHADYLRHMRFGV